MEKKENGEPQGMPDEQKAKKYLLFKDVIDSFPAEEKEEAQYHQEMFRRVNALWGEYPQLHSYICDFINNLIKEKGRDVRRCKLFHLYSSSSLEPLEWESFPLDTPGGDFSSFVRNKLEPMIRQLEEKRRDSEQ